MIVSNTTPISNFIQLERFEILSNLFSTIFIPRAVKQEIDDYFSMSDVWREALSRNFVEVVQIENTSLVSELTRSLHLGESETICLCLERNVDLCLLDDKDARNVAEFYKISVTGTLGILLQSKRKGFITKIKPIMDELRNRHQFWISDPMYRKVLNLASE
jgi:uncharacterized protein